MFDCLFANSHGRRRFFTYALCISCLFAFNLPAVAQDAKTLERVQNLKNPFLKKEITVYYSPGYEKRAKEVQSLIEDALKFYEQNLNVKVELSVAVLNKAQWEQVAQIPYDVLFASDPPHIAFVPATFGEGVVTAGVTKTKSLATPATLQKLKSLGYNFEKAQEKSVDFIALHEVGHVVAETLGLVEFPGKPNKWLSEFIASYLAYAFLREKRLKIANLVETVFDHNAAALPPQKYTALADFERLYLGVGPENYGWYQNRFVKRAIEVYNAKGLSFIEGIRRNPFPKGQTLPPEEVLQKLENIAPGFINWSKNL
jgi:hypothetical protein